MRLRRVCTVCPLLTITLMVLVACGNLPSQQSGSNPTAASPASARVPTTETLPTAEHVTAFAGLSSGLDNTKQARIRATNAVMGSSNVDVFINGLPAFNGGKAQANMGVSAFSGWLYVTPGTYTVALVPHGGTVAQTLVVPVAVKAAAGHRYTVAAVGQLKDKHVTSLVVDETALEAGIGIKPTDDVLIDINNVSGIPGIDEQVAGNPTTAHITYGTAQAYRCPIGRPHAITSAMGKPDTIMGQGDNTCEPATSKILIDYGTYPGDGKDSQLTSELNVLDFLAGFNRYHVATDEGHLLTFNTLLAAIDKAGMRDQFMRSSPYFFFAPTDEAFAALPKDKRDALLNDPQALTRLLKAHFVAGYYPAGSLSGGIYGHADAEVTNLLGQKLRLQDSIINGVEFTGPNHTVGNGNRVQLIEQLLPVQ